MLVTMFVRVTLSCLMVVVLSWGLSGCGDHSDTSEPSETGLASQAAQAAQIAEVAPPPVFQQLRPSLDSYQPQVTILTPEANQVLEDTTVSVQVQLQDLPTFKDAELEMGPHLHVILDDQPYRAVYEPDQPIVFEDLSPGTHTLRVFASRPWHESFKNEGAYDQRTFHLFTETHKNTPDPSKPLLTYSRPKGSYGAEPIMLDFYLANAPLRLVAQENPDNNIIDWQIRVTVNGQSFLLNDWLPVYLEGFRQGTNWVQLEFLDEEGNLVENAFNNTVQLITYESGGQDSLSKLVRGELSAEAARGIVDASYSAQPTPQVEEQRSRGAEEKDAQTRGAGDAGTEETSPSQHVESSAPTEAKPSEEPRGEKRLTPEKPTTLPEIIEESPSPEPEEEDSQDKSSQSDQSESSELVPDSATPSEAGESGEVGEQKPSAEAPGNYSSLRVPEVHLD